MTLKEFAQQLGLTDEQILNTHICSIGMDADHVEKVRTQNTGQNMWVEKYIARRTFDIHLQFVQVFPPEFYDE